MVEIKRYKTITVIFIVLIILSILWVGYGSQRENQDDSGFVKKNNISSFKIHNILCQEKEIKNKWQRNKIIDLINSAKIIKNDVEERAGIGYGVTITYSNGQIFSASFLSNTMSYSKDDSKATWCEIDKNILDELRSYYDIN